jgi:hypothetical protein
MGALSAASVRDFASSMKASEDFVSFGNAWAIKWCSPLMAGAAGFASIRSRRNR